MSNNLEMKENTFYHIYNYGNNLDIIFYDDDNYKYFLRKFDFYLSEFLDVFAFCLLPNQFHFLVKVKKNEIFLNFNNLNLKDNDSKIKKILMQERFRIFYMSYSKAINKSYSRKGSLFQKNFRRTRIATLDNLKKYVCFIHYLPNHYNLTSEIGDYKFCSYNKILMDKKTKLKKDEVLGWFKGKNNYIEYHDNLKYIDSLLDESMLGI